MSNQILIRGAREHNLKGVDISLPRDSLIVFTGLSGSGKSSLAFDTIFREGQRRFMESLSPYARQFLGQLEKPLVDHIEGLSPTICIDQKTVNRNPRSTVGTVTEIYDHYRLLFARIAIPHCPQCGREVSRQTPEQIADSLYLEAYPDGEVLEEGAKRGMILAPIIQERKGEYRKELSELVQEGFLRARIDGEVRDLREEIVLDRYVRHTIEVVMDRVTFNRESRSRVVEAIEQAITRSNGVVSALIEDTYHRYATERACPTCRISIPELEPRLFSFNAPQGACPDCEGLGERGVFSLSKIIANPEVSIFEGALRCLTKEGRVPFSGISVDELAVVIRFHGEVPTNPWGSLSEACRSSLLLGNKAIQYFDGTKNRTFQGIVPALELAWKYTRADFLNLLRETDTCPTCQGKRLSPVSLAVTFRGKNIWDLSVQSVDDAFEFFSSLQPTTREQVIGREIFKEIMARIHFLREVGLGYLSLNRSAATLSGGEAQRIRLAGQVGSGLQGVLYVLDEPSIGLHPRDNRRLLNTLLRLRDLGNTVLVVEHDKETMEASDYLVDIGPGAGREGGRVMAEGTVAEVLKGSSLTARYLKGEEDIPLPARRRPGNGSAVTIVNARQNNLRGVTVSIPLGAFIAVTGVSGSGKSTLVTDILHKSLAAQLHRAGDVPGLHDRIDGIDNLDKVIEIDQSPIGRTPRSNPVTYTGVFDDIRTLFADVPEARVRGYGKGRFSFNVAGGRCEACQGAGVKEIEMQFLANVEIPCEVCAGKRFNHETLAIRYKGKSIADVLEMTVAEAAEFFSARPKIKKVLDTLLEVGLNYVALGQPSSTLSGGEAQRVKLATELHRPATGRTLYILDEPTTGLHMADVKRLLHALQRLVEAGNTVLVIEHNLDVIKVADYLIDLGPEGGKGGGELLAAGTPEQVAAVDASYTGRFLRELFEVTPGHPLHKGGAVTPSPTAIAPRPIRLHARDLVVKGAHKNNLRHVDVSIPKNKLTVITGVSGSGKTSLAFDTLFAEGQRRYVESLSTYARRFLGRLDKAPVESIDGIAPSISVDQKTTSRSPRSTVATSTEINDYLRLLYARVGQPHCPGCGETLIGYSPTLAARTALERFPGARAEVLAPLLESTQAVNPAALDVAPTTSDEAARPQRKSTLQSGPLLSNGFLRVRVDDQLLRLDVATAPPLLEGTSIELVVDRVTLDEEGQSRAIEAFETAFKQGDGVGYLRLETGERVGFSTTPGCLKCAFYLREELSPQLFSFNSHVGACVRCSGLGTTEAFHPERVLMNPTRPLFDGALAPLVQRIFERKGPRYESLVEAVGREEGIPVKAAFAYLSESQRKLLLFGAGEKFYSLEKEGSAGAKKSKAKAKAGAMSLRWRGILPILEGWFQEPEGLGEKTKEELRLLMHDVPCPTCGGARLKKLPLAVKVGGLNIAAASRKTVLEALDHFQGLSLAPTARRIAEQILQEISSRLGFLRDVGLDYLSLDRSSATLSGGESQRIRLAGQLGSHLMGVLYVLDEPTIGLHPRDTDRLLATLTGLRDRGNTVVVVEHDAQTMALADYLVDLGPGAGDRGGRVMAQGTPAEIQADPASITGAFLSGRRMIPVPIERRPGGPGVTIRGATAHNLKGVDVHFPSRSFVCVTGVSGSGKSSLVMDILARGLAMRLNGAMEVPGPHRSLEMDPSVQRVGIIDQSPLGRSPKSNPASYTGMMDHLRDLFASTPEAKSRGYQKGRFSFNMAGGRCEACEGRGAIKVEMHFLSDVWVTCERCKGQRYNEQTLQVTFKGKNIADVLKMEISEALDFFRNQRRIYRMLKPLEDVGLGYMQVGQPANTMSGGEAQRVKLASALMERNKSGFFILDEPTTGLHFQDVEKLIQVLQNLVDRGNTVVVIEHNPDMMKVADYLIDMGPEGGDRGGQLVATGTPEQLAVHGSSHTGRYLRDVLAGAPRGGRPGGYVLSERPEEAAEEEVESDGDVEREEVGE